ncbi:hypothetical protein OH77DRAFT_1440262 [Trametes cingulata]|nr:hypothetical protein OH77DRAFT_1440262 [Trametes cingulata]
MLAALLLTLAGALPLVSSHASIWHPSMYGFNVTDKTFPYDNRPVSPLMAYTFDQWWFHGHLDYPPNPGDIFELPAGKPATTEIACNKGATTWFNSSEGGDIRQGDSPCPNSDPSAYHTTGFDDLKGCALAIAYKSDARQVQPEDFTVFSVNQTCVWTRFTNFQVPARMPPCPEGGCTCAWFWIHSPDSGGEQNYMTGFKCNVTGSTSNVPLAKPQLPRRCGADPANNKPDAAPGNCTYGAKQPFYWFQKERNNMFEGTYSPPFYTDLYNFKDGAQDDIFVDSYPNGLPAPSPNSTFVPTPFLGDGIAQAPAGGASESASGMYSYSVTASATSSAGAGASTSAAVSASAGAGSSSAGGGSSASVASGSSIVQSSAPSTTFSASTLSQTASFSAATSSSLSPELPLSTSSMAFPSASASSAAGASGASSTPHASGSHAVATSTVVSTLVVTITAGAPASSASAVTSTSSGSVISSASSALPTAGVSSASAKSSAQASSQETSAAARSTIFLNGPPSASASSTVSASATPSGSSNDAASASASAGNAASTTIDLNFAVDPNSNKSAFPADSVRAAVKPGVLAAAPTNAMW